ncbi:DUF4297 domain-containing protein [Anaerobacillus sp. HL2]|nr:DUF4297 domain-containing protein [Anaerobacillus sp. HL2]
MIYGVSHDVIILDTSSQTSNIEFYQIKTDNSSSRYFTVAKMVKDSEKYPKKMSILQK